LAVLKNTHIAVLGLVFLFAGFESCANREEEQPADDEPATTQESPAENTPAANGNGTDRRITLGPENETPQTQTRPEGNENQRRTASRRARSRDFIVAARPGEGYLPEEFEIGPLADRYSTDADRRAVYRTAQNFFTKLGDGELPSESIHPSSRTSIRRTLDLAFSEGYLPRRAVLGRIIISEGSARLNVSLYGDPGRTAGEVTVATEGNEWYISDIQVDLSKLDVEPNEDERFEPVSYDWQIHSR
jgi:hypothetical protein